MKRWSVDSANQWYAAQPWLVGCNFIPSTAINQLEMWQAETYDPTTIDKELAWAEKIGFNTLRVFLHDLVWSHDSKRFCTRMDDFLAIANRHGMKVMFALFDDCHRPDPVFGVQPLPVPGVHNSGWKHSPGQKIVLQFHDGSVQPKEKTRLRDYVHGVLTRFAEDERILAWDVYNEPGQSGNDDKTNELLTATWQWAREVRVIQPLTACLDGSCGKRNIALNAAQSDVITFHCYDGQSLENTITQVKTRYSGRLVICTEYMAREHGTTFQHSLPIFKKHRIGCYNWGLVAGKTQTHWNWKSVENMERLKAQGAVLKPSDSIPEPPLWFHDIFRKDGIPFDQAEVDFIRAIMRQRGSL